MRVKEQWQAQLARVKRSTLARDTTHLSVGQGLRILIQAVYFIVIARLLGPDSYGAFVSVVAIAAAIGPFALLGTPNLFIKNVRSGKRKPTVCWGNGLLITVVAGFVCTLGVCLVQVLFHLKGSLSVVLLVCLSDLVLMRITELAAFGFTAMGRMRENATLGVVVVAMRLVAIVLLGLVQKTVTLNEWVGFYFGVSVLGMIYVVIKSNRYWGSPELQLGLIKEDVIEGVFFSISASATSVYNDIDKVMLGQMSDFTSTGIYAAAYRVIDVSMTPVRSLVSAAYPVFFEKGVAGMGATYSYATRLIRKSSVYGILMFVGLWLTAPILPWFLGPQYSAVVPAMRWLSLIPLMRCFHAFLADSLSGAGHQQLRTAIQVFVGLVNVGANYIILPRYSWRGAAWTSLGCDGMLIILFWAIIPYLIRQDNRKLMQQGAPATPAKDQVPV